MRRQLIYLGTILILVLCLSGQVLEIFDRWDNTFQTGNDSEYSTVIVALIAGAVLSLARFALSVFHSVSARFGFLSLSLAHSAARIHPVVFIGYSPPAPLRI